MYDVYASGSIAATPRSATYYGASSSAASQCIAVSSTFQLTTTDSFANIAWADSTGAALNGNASARFAQNLLLSCVQGSDKARALAVRSDTGATVFSPAMAPVMVANAVAFQSMECDATRGVASGATQLTFGADKSANVQDATDNSVTPFTTAQVQQAFSTSGLTLGNGTVIRWTLYAVPAGALIKQVIVHRATKPDGTVNVFAFVQG
ncbi:hypothetical protein [Roseateles sp. BYS87W]|uniref:Uncharacterized protein n=1 Tax=Pelomonas baiyunensis TaxID=3299026 RepID=A0ABW7H5J5_9BURK